MSKPEVSIVLLTYNRPAEISRNVSELLTIDDIDLELIVIDNYSEQPVVEVMPSDNRLKVIRMTDNLGVGGRNHGIRAAKADVIVTLDDDVFGFDGSHARYLLNRFERDSGLAAINFKVIDDLDEKQVNWIHHRVVEVFGSQSFDSYEISEGAVAFRRDSLERTNLYPSYFFISHEGPDLALQLIKTGGRVVYDPEVVVRHSHAEAGRASWRRYYYDTRNQFWLVARHYPIGLAIAKLFIGLGAMFVYSLRDRYLRYYLKGIKDGIKGIQRPLGERKVIAGEQLSYFKSMMKKNPSLLYMVKKRIFSTQVRI